MDIKFLKPDGMQVMISPIKCSGFEEIVILLGTIYPEKNIKVFLAHSLR